MITFDDDGNYIVDTGVEPVDIYDKVFKDSDGNAPQVIVVMGATGSGKSRLAIELASHFSNIEIINADSMQVYKGLDVLTNKVPLSDQKGVPHHLLGAVDPSMEFTSRDFRDLAVPIIDDILSREHIPLIVGGTNYYIQALVSTYLADDLVEDKRDGFNTDLEDCYMDLSATHERLKEIDPIAAKRIHPNDHRKINRYLSLYASTGVLPSTLFQGKAAEIRRLNRLKTYFGWNLHQINATEVFLSNTEDAWYTTVMEPCVAIVSNFLSGGISDVTTKFNDIRIQSHDSRDLWSQYVCEACGNKILRGAHEWQQHQQGRGHHKRILSLKQKAGNPYL